ncbi:MAG: response regulator transcription factor [Treponema sp.]|nr:response regulator transcription factor [Treponema sp.]MDY3756633.1 response regulator transcription factor [Treponema sp.]
MNKVILVDDHKMLRKGVTTYLLENSDWTVIGEAESLAELEPLLKQLTFSEEDNIVAVVDLQLKGDGNNALSANGYTAIQMLAEQNIPSVIFSSNATGACIEKALSIQGGGVRGFVSKASSESMLLDAINAVAQGKSFIQPDLVLDFFETRNLFSILTRREKEVINLIGEELTNEQIAEKLKIKINTLENYISIIYDKLGCKDRASLLEKIR